jgi:type II secretory pathway component PulF
MVIFMASVIIIYLNTSVFVQFRAIKPIDQWPDAGKQLVAVAELIQYWWWVVIVAVVVTVIALGRILDNYVGELRPLLDKFPPFNLYRRFASARVLETLGLLVANGVIFKSAIKVMKYQANPYVKSHLTMMEHLLSMGKSNVADVLSTGLIDKQDVLRLRVMAEVKGFEHGLVRMGVHGAEQTTKTLKFIGKIFGGILMGVGAGLIIIILRGIFLTGMSLGGG